MKNIVEIYKDYRTMPNLVMHQMRVAAVAMQIIKSLDMEVDKESVVKACLLHDMGNIIKFQLDFFPEWNKPDILAYWQGVKEEYILKYGSNEHKASLLIADELGASVKTKDLVYSVDSASVEMIANEDDFDRKLCLYADGRVSPSGVVSINERSLEAKKRYENHRNKFDEERRIFHNTNLNLIEKQIFSHTSIRPEDINDESIKDYLEKLKSYFI
ncbi:MAG: HD domain-containing protein [Candidatus Nomurabacteria bacterium]|nr:HD domain-containing protein [Candidatus Nomurabacteria bacterium]